MMAWCGCWYIVRSERVHYNSQKQYLPQVDLNSSTKILGTTSQRTELQQTFINSTGQKLDEVRYTFPLYDGVSVVGFKCTVGSKVLEGIVKEKNQARTEYQEAVAKGETAGLLEQLPDASDAFNTTIGNVAANEKVVVEITYLGELKHDAETDGTRFTIPTIIAPRYGSPSFDTAKTLHSVGANDSAGIKISVDVELEKGSIIRGLQSPSHPIAVTMGRTSTMKEDAFENNYASSRLTLNSTELGKDFVIVVLSKDPGTPQALMESHPTIPGQRAIMATLVPKFNIPNIVPEIVFVVDRSGSMDGNIGIVVEALKVFLKSLPLNGIKFNICSFGSRYSFLFKKSQTYSQSSLDEALRHVDTFDSNFGGTEMLAPIVQTCAQRYKDMPLEVMLLTDGQIWNQQELFDFINKQSNARFFSLGIGSGASSSLVEGIARAGHGFAQFVDTNEKMDKRVVRMLKAALTPHINDYKLSVNYAAGGDDEFEIVASSDTSIAETAVESSPTQEKKPISLFDASSPESELPSKNPAARFDALPAVSVPAVLQAPHQIPALYPFNRTTAYLLLSPSEQASNPVSLTLRGTSTSGPLELTIPIQTLSTPSETLHQLAAKKAVQELEQGRGWLYDIKTSDSKTFKEKHEGQWDLIVERECVRLGAQFQVAGKFTSFVAVERKSAQGDGPDAESKTYEVIVPERLKPHPSGLGPTLFGSAQPQAKVAKSRSGGLFGRVRASAPMANAPMANAPMASFAPGAAPSSPPKQFFAMSAFAPSPTGGASFGGAQPQFKKRSARTARPEPYNDTQKMEMEFSAAMPLPADDEDLDDDLGIRADRLSLVGAAPAQPAQSSLFGGFRARKLSAKEGKQAQPPPPPPPAGLSDQEKMHQVIGMQRFDGSWPASEALWKLLVVYEQVVRAKVLDAGGSGDVGSDVLATVAALAWLKSNMAGEQEVWEMVAEKAEAWLEGKGGAEQWVREVMALF